MSMALIFDLDHFGYFLGNLKCYSFCCLPIINSISRKHVIPALKVSPFPLASNKPQIHYLTQPAGFILSNQCSGKFASSSHSLITASLTVSPLAIPPATLNDMYFNDTYQKLEMICCTVTS